MIDYPWFSKRYLLQSQKDDPFNRNNSRTVRNTNKYTYNCGGYALECFTWWNGSEDISFFWFDPDDRGEAERITSLYVKELLADFPDMRTVDSLDDIRENEYAILFRLSSDGDFHFLKRDRGNHWRHKMGNWYEIDTIKQSEIFDIWCGIYNGPIVIFAKERR